MKKIKRMCFFLIKGSFTLLHSGLSPLDPFSFFFKKKQPFSSLLSWLDMSFGRVSRAHDLRLWFKPRRTNKHKQLLSVPGLLSSPHSDAPLFFFFLSLSLSVSLYCWWKAAETTWLLVWEDTTGRKRSKESVTTKKTRKRRRLLKRPALKRISEELLSQRSSSPHPEPRKQNVINYTHTGGFLCSHVGLHKRLMAGASPKLHSNPQECTSNPAEGHRDSKNTQRFMLNYS